MPLEWSPHMRLGIAPLDDARRTFLGNLARLECQTDQQLFGSLAELLAGMERLFLAEEALMRRLHLPSAVPHRAQHASIQSLLRQALDALQGADSGPAREAVALLPYWFMHHLSTMDLELAVAANMLAREPGG